MSQYPVKKVLLLFALLFLFTGLSFGEKTGYPKTGEEKVMKRVGSLIKVRPEYEERYIILHRNTFPGVLDRIRKSNIRNYSIFLLNGILFSYYEYVGQDFDADMKSIADSVTKDWWKLTDPMQEPLPTRKPGEWWAEMDQLLCLKNSPALTKERIGQVAEIIPGKEENIKNILKNYPHDLEDVFNQEHFQNLNIFFKDGKLYFYYEYTGNDIEKSFRSISENDKFLSFQKELRQYMVQKTDGPWQLMKAVFHTN